MKSSRFNKKYTVSASKLHKQVGDLLKDSLFKNYQIFQEYPVNKINPSYPSGREKFDWYIKELNIIIEVHGQQHYFPVCFGGITDEEAEKNFKRQQFRDVMKKEAALSAGATYIVIKYNEEINAQTLFEKLTSINEELEEVIDYLPDSNPLLKEFEEKILVRKEKRQERMHLKELASERRKQIRKWYKSSEKYKNQLEKAKKFRKQAYDKAKESKTLEKGKRMNYGSIAS